MCPQPFDPSWALASKFSNTDRFKVEIERKRYLGIEKEIKLRWDLSILNDM